MKIALVSFGHVDVTLSLVKSLSKFAHVDLYLSFALNNRKESIINFENTKIYEGILDHRLSGKILGKEIMGYIDNKFSVRFFIYNNLKLRSLKNLKLSFKFSRILKKYDIIHFNGQDGVLPHLVFLLSNKELVFTIHDSYPHSGENRQKFPELLNKFIIKSKRQVILHNNHDFNKVMDLFPKKKKKLNRIPFGYLDIYTKYLRKEKRMYKKSDILFFGRISPYKGIKYLIEAIKIAKKSLPGIKVVIAGSGNFNCDITGINHDKSFEIVNRFIHNDELAGLIHSTKIVVCPYTDATQSGVVMTSYAFYKPVIATNVGGLPEVVKENLTGKLIPPKDPISLAKAIIELKEDEKELTRMSRNIESLYNSGKYSWDYIAKQTLDVYKNALEGK